LNIYIEIFQVLLILATDKSCESYAKFNATTLRILSILSGFTIKCFLILTQI